MFVSIRRGVGLVLAGLILAAAVPCAAYLVDGGPPQHAGVGVRDGSSCVWAAEPFVLSYDAYVTTLGAAIARALGPADAGFDVYLTSTIAGLPGSAITRLPEPLIPLTTQYAYYYGSFAGPVYLTAGVYYLVFTPTSTSFYGSISYSLQAGMYYGLGTGNYGQSWYVLSYPLAVRVDGWYVPEPSALGAIVAGLAALVLYMRRAGG